MGVIRHSAGTSLSSTSGDLHPPPMSCCGVKRSGEQRVSRAPLTAGASEARSPVVEALRRMLAKLRTAGMLPCKAILVWEEKKERKGEFFNSEIARLRSKEKVPSKTLHVRPPSFSSLFIFFLTWGQ